MSASFERACGQWSGMRDNSARVASPRAYVRARASRGSNAPGTGPRIGVPQQEGRSRGRAVHVRIARACARESESVAPVEARLCDDGLLSDSLPAGGQMSAVRHGIGAVIVRQTCVMLTKPRARDCDRATALTTVQQRSTARMLGHNNHFRSRRSIPPSAASRARARVRARTTTLRRASAGHPLPGSGRRAVAGTGRQRRPEPLPFPIARMRPRSSSGGAPLGRLAPTRGANGRRLS
jgi:hypothetical protein